VPNVSNLEFLQAVFGADWRSALVASFTGDPGAPPTWAWTAYPAAKYVPGNPNANNYYCISTFDPATGGRHRRRKDLHRATYAIVLDDVLEKLSEKVVLDQIGPPSARIATSPASQQWVYILEPPEKNRAKVDALLDGLVAAAGLNPGGIDPGMKGVTRLVRLPVGSNGKPKYGPGGAACQLLEWAPHLRFTMDGLAAAFSIDIDRAAPAAVKPREAKAAAGAHKIPPGERDLVLEQLRILGRVKGATGDGHLDIICPFADEHTDGAVTGTAYLSGGGFKCHHGHCQDRKTPEYLAKLDQIMRDEGHGDWRAKQEFEDADKQALGDLLGCFERGEKPSRGHYDAVACVPKAEMDRHLAPVPALYGTDPKPIHAGLARARARLGQAGLCKARLAMDDADRVLPLPAGYIAPMPLAEVQARSQAILAEFNARVAARVARGAGAARPASPAPRIPLRGARP